VSKIIEFLEQLGQDATLRYATDAELEAALLQAGLNPADRTAILGKDQRLLEALLDAKANVCCMVANPKEPDPDGLKEAEEGEREVKEKKDDKAKSLKSPAAPARRAA
jgi:hypothetical protein